MVRPSGGDAAGTASSSASSYTVSGGILHLITARLKDFGKAACWTAATSGPNLPQFAYVTNTNSDSVSGFAIASDGTLSLVNPDGNTAQLPRGAFPLELTVSNDNKYLYVLEGDLPGVAGFQIQTDGTLVQIQDAPEIPLSSSGMTGY